MQDADCAPHAPPRPARESFHLHGLHVDLHGPAEGPADAAPPLSDIAVAPMWKVEKALIDKALAMTDGNVPRAAALLEISPSTIYRKKQMWEEQGKDKTGSGSIDPTYGVRSIL